MLSVILGISVLRNRDWRNTVLRERLGVHCAERECVGTLWCERDCGNTVLREKLGKYCVVGWFGGTLC